ncbi:hypothetical protein Tco_0486402 [Tanacetum coccineum]
MSSMGELTFFLGLQVKQKEDGIFISQDKYVAEILKKFDFAKLIRLLVPPIENSEDLSLRMRKPVMWGMSILYRLAPSLSSSALVKRIFRYLKGKPNWVFGFLGVSSFDLESYSGRSFLAMQKRHYLCGYFYYKGEYVAAVQACLWEVLMIQNSNVSLWVQLYEHNVTLINGKHHLHCKESKYIIQKQRFAIRGLIGLREVIDGTEALLLPTLFILWLDTVSTDSAKLVPLGKVCTAIETLKKNTAKGTKSIRSDLLFDDANGIDSLPNQAIFDAIQLMGYEGDLTVLTFNKALFSPQWRFFLLVQKAPTLGSNSTNIANAVICLTSNQKY